MRLNDSALLNSETGKIKNVQQLNKLWYIHTEKFQRAIMS